jgi:DNA-binding transcriptional regulator GbsR (MarR family)
LRRREIEAEERRAKCQAFVDHQCEEWERCIREVTELSEGIQKEAKSRAEKQSTFACAFVTVPSRPAVSMSLRVLLKVDAARGLQFKTHVHDDYFKTCTLYVSRHWSDHDDRVLATATRFVVQVKLLNNSFT